jgi:hypothetical protein
LVFFFLDLLRFFFFSIKIFSQDADELILQRTSIGSGVVYPGFFIGIVIVVTDNPAIQVSRAGAALRDFGIRIGWLELDGVGT